MATQPITDVRNAEVESFSSRKGEIKLCQMCRNATLPPSMRVHCKWCLGTGYVAVCLPCKGTGIITAVAAWDGKSKHGSTCDTCGGLKFIPSRESEYDAYLLKVDPEAHEKWIHRNDPPPPPPPASAMDLEPKNEQVEKKEGEPKPEVGATPSPLAPAVTAK